MLLTVPAVSVFIIHAGTTLKDKSMLSNALKLIRQYHAMDQRQVAMAVGIAVSTVSMLETGTRVPSYDILCGYSKAFNIPVSSILFFSEELENEDHEKVRVFVAEKVLKILNWVVDKG